jgi:hypothetical protein
MTLEVTRDLESKLAFALEHPAVAADRGTLTRLLGEPDQKRQVVDYWHEGDRVLLGALIRDARTTKVARTGYQADIPALRRMNPALMTLSAWLAERGWKPANA